MLSSDKDPMRLTNAEFLNQFLRLSQEVSKKGNGSLLVTFTRYDAQEEYKLPPQGCSRGLQEQSHKKVSSKPEQPESKSAESKTETESTTTQNTTTKSQAHSKKSRTNTTQTNPEQTSADTTAAGTSEERKVSMASLVKVKLGNRKISTVVDSKSLPTFRDQFATIFRAHTSPSLVAEGQMSKRLINRIKASKSGKSGAKAGSTATATAAGAK